MFTTCVDIKWYNPKLLKITSYSLIDETVFLWFGHARENGIPIPGHVIKEKV